MYILVQHTVRDPAAFWNATDPTLLPPAFKLLQTFPTRDGTHAACVWEAASIDALRGLFEPMIGAFGRNEYFEVENRDGVAMPSGVARAATRARG
ncbi:MAG: hypothetical protein ACXW0Z_07220 [Gemmatirosa sp.]